MVENSEIILVDTTRMENSQLQVVFSFRMFLFVHRSCTVKTKAPQNRQAFYPYWYEYRFYQEQSFQDL